MGRSSWWRLAAHGLLAGVLLSVLRAPLGLDWTQIPATLGSTAALFRGAALFALALALDSSRTVLGRGLGRAWLAALCAGFGLHSLLLDCAPETAAGYAFTLVVLTLVLRLLCGPRGSPDLPSRAPLGWGERTGLLLAGLGAGLALESVAREVRLFTLGTQEAESIVALVFLALVLAGAVAFGPLWGRLGGKLHSESTRFALGLGLASAAGLAGLCFLDQLSPGGLHVYLRRIDVFFDWGRALDTHLGGALGLAAVPTLDGSSIGTLWTTAILAGAAFIGPCFLLGASVGSCAHVGRPAHALAGAALGLRLVPECLRALARPLTPDQLDAASPAWHLLFAGALVAALGIAIVSLSGERGTTRWIGFAGAMSIAAVPWIRPHLVLWSFSPWSPATVSPDLVQPTPEGLVTVEHSRDGTAIVTLDRRRLTPTADEEEVDEQRLRASWSLLPEGTRKGRVRALFIGQLTPARARVLDSLGDLDLERTAPWDSALPAVEGLLFTGEDPPPGRLVRPGEARARLNDEAYDWVIVPPVQGAIVSWKSESRELWGSTDAPRLAHLDLDGTTVGVAWVEADSRAPRGAAFSPAILVQSRLESLTIGVVRGRAADSAGQPWFTLDSVSGPSPLAFLCTMPQQRSYSLQRALTAGLASSSAPRLVQGLAAHFAAQTFSSPYESRAEQVELEEDVLRSLLAALPASGPPDTFTRGLWETLAWLLTEKRMPEQALAFLEPVADRFAPWPALDRAVGRAYREVLEPEAALRSLERALAATPEDIGALVECAACARELGDPRRGVDFLERALAVQPGRPDLERAWALALMEAGDARGREIVERLAAEAPEDQELKAALGAAAPSEDGR